MKRKAVKRRMAVACVSIAALLAVAAASLLLASGIFVAPRYLEPWDKDYYRQFADPRIRLAAHGLLAASGHNSQPWRIRLDRGDPDTFYLYADSERLTLQVDPLARQTMVSQGTFLEYVRVAAEELGYEADISLFPDGEYDEERLTDSMREKPVAKVVVKQAAAASRGSPLYNGMFLPDTNRAPYQAASLTEDEIDKLLATTDAAGISLRIFDDESNREKLGGYAVAGAIIEAGVHRINEESALIFRANEYQKNKYRSGFSVEGQGTGGMMKHIMQGLVTLIPSLNSEKASADRFVASTRTAIEHTPAYAMIMTEGNSRIQEVKSGMLYSRLVLTAHSLGLVMQPPSQVLEEYAEMEEQYAAIHRDYAPEGSTIQMLFRLGRPTREFPLTMRRDVMELIEP